MKKITMVLALMAGLSMICLGCGKKAPEEKPEPAGDTEAVAENWEPETAEQPAAHDPNDGHDHSGHNH